jgi:hypothetical protein
MPAKKVDRPQEAVNPAIPIVPAANREEAARATLPTTGKERLKQVEKEGNKEEGKIPAAGVNPDAE